MRKVPADQVYRDHFKLRHRCMIPGNIYHRPHQLFTWHSRSQLIFDSVVQGFCPGTSTPIAWSNPAGNMWDSAGHQRHFFTAHYLWMREGTVAEDCLRRGARVNLLRQAEAERQYRIDEEARVTIQALYDGLYGTASNDKDEAKTDKAGDDDKNDGNDCDADGGADSATKSKDERGFFASIFGARLEMKAPTKAAK